MAESEWDVEEKKDHHAWRKTCGLDDILDSTR